MTKNSSAGSPARQQRVEQALSEITAEAQNLAQALDGLLSELRLTGDLDQLSGSLQAVYDRLKPTLGQSPDIVLRKFTVGPQGAPALVAFVNGQVDNAQVDRDTLMLAELAVPPTATPATLFALLKDHFVAVGHVKTANRWSDILPAMLLGMTLLFVDGVAEVLMLDTVKFPARAVSRAQSEPSIKGPQEAFTEVLLTQMNQLRRRLPSASLRFDAYQIGSDSHTTVIVAYLAHLANPAIVSSVKARVAGIQRASVQTANEIGEYLAERRFTIFPQLRFSERVDLVARNLAQGKVAILTANDPTALVLPNTLMDFYQTSQDYVFPFWDGTLMRIIRLAGLAVGLYLMPFYIALTSVNPDLLPIKLLLTIDGSRQGMPFPPVAEVIIMWLIIEILREAANRLPQQLATTIGTVGAVVVGTAIVKAGLVDALMIIIVTLTALGLFTVPALELASTWRWLFWALIVAAWGFGIYGIVAFTVVLIVHVTSLQNFGVPYLSPFAPLRMRDLGDSWIRLPFPRLPRRPVTLRPLVMTQAEPDMVNPSPNLHQAQSRYKSP